MVRFFTWVAILAIFAIQQLSAFAPQQQSKLCGSANHSFLRLSSQKDDFWDLQEKLAKDLSTSTQKSLKE